MTKGDKKLSLLVTVCHALITERINAMNKQHLSAVILDYIATNSEASYAEIELLFDKNGFDYRGDIEIHSSTNDNVIFWAGWNEEAVSLIGELIKTGKIKRIARDRSLYPIVRLMDGKAMPYPLLRENPDRIKHPHWLPCVFIGCANFGHSRKE